MQKWLHLFFLFRMAMAWREQKDPVKRTRLYSCLRCPYFNDIRGVKGHVVARHLGVEEAPFHCTLCTVKYTESGPWVKHANSDGHRARVFLMPAQAANALGRSEWDLRTSGQDADARPWGTDESNRFWELQQQMKVSPSFLTLDNLCEESSLVEQPLPDSQANCPNVPPSSTLPASLSGDASDPPVPPAGCTSSVGGVSTGVLVCPDTAALSLPPPPPTVTGLPDPSSIPPPAESPVVADSSANVADPPIDTAPVPPSLSLSTSLSPSSSAVPPPSSSSMPLPPHSSNSPMLSRADPVFEPELLENMPSPLSPHSRTPIMELLQEIFPTPGATAIASIDPSVKPQEGPLPASLASTEVVDLGPMASGMEGPKRLSRNNPSPLPQQPPLQGLRVPPSSRWFKKPQWLSPSWSTRTCRQRLQPQLTARYHCNGCPWAPATSSVQTGCWFPWSRRSLRHGPWKW